KEGGEGFIGKKRCQYVRRSIRVAAPIRAQLEGHDDACDDAHAEGDAENLGPEHRNAGVYLATSGEVEAFDDRDKSGGADGKGRQKDMPADHPGELNAR